MINKLIKFILILATLALPTISFAYIETTDGGQLTAEMYPKDAGPFTNVHIRLVSYEIDLDRSTVVWTINGKKTLEGVGQIDLNFTTGPAGKRILIDIRAISQDGKIITKEISMIPAEVDILWQSDGYVPPFYRGKSLIARGNNVKFVALPSFLTEAGIPLDSAKLVYKWAFNSENILSGYGKSSVKMNVTEPNTNNTVSVDVSNLDNTIKATKKITPRTTEPLPLFYEVSPLLGTNYTKSILNVFQMSSAETAIKIVPYFYNSSGVVFAWGLNSEDPVPTNDNSNVLIVRQSEGNRGESILNTRIYSPYQTIKKSITIKFGQTSLGF